MQQLQGLSGREFTRWLVWLDTEQVGPEWDAWRHAQLLAALHNGPLQKPDKSVFSAAEFMRRDPWTPHHLGSQLLTERERQLAAWFAIDGASA